MASNSSNPVEYQPPLVLKDSQLSQLRSWKVGKTYYLLVEAEQLSLDAPDSGGMGESKHWTARFKVKNVSAVDNKNGTMDDKIAKSEALKRLKY